MAKTIKIQAIMVWKRGVGILFRTIISVKMNSVAIIKEKPTAKVDNVFLLLKTIEPMLWLMKRSIKVMSEEIIIIRIDICYHSMSHWTIKIRLRMLLSMITMMSRINM